MPKRATKPGPHSWAVYHLKGTPAKLVGIVYDQPDEQLTIKQAIEEFKVPAKPARPADRAAAGLRI
jgi:hypothetical protein